MNANETPAGALVPNYRALKATVIILGVLILLAFGALVGGLLLGATGTRNAARGEPFATAITTVPGARVAGAELVGSRLVVQVEDRNGGLVVLVDTASGEILGRVMLDPVAE
jgi:hypothetical protein